MGLLATIVYQKGTKREYSDPILGAHHAEFYARKRGHVSIADGRFSESRYLLGDPVVIRCLVYTAYHKGTIM